MPKSARAWVVSLFLLSSFASQVHAEPRKPTHVACVGDSITYGMGASTTAKNYVSQLQTLLGNGVQVKNYGNSGSTLLGPGYGDKPYVQQTEYTSATSFVSGAGANAVVSVVIMLGTNDSKPQNWEPSGKPKNDMQFATDYKALIDHFQGLSTKPSVYIAYPVAAYTNSYGIRGDVIHDQQIPLIHQVAVDKRVPLIDLNTDTLNHPEYFGDGVHPNDSGYTVMTNLVKKGLAREPTIKVTSPSMGASVGGGMLALSADASGDTVDISAVEFFEGQTSLGKASSKPFSVMWAATPGQHTITAKATDTTLASATSDPVSFTVGAGGNSGGGGAGGAGQSGSGGSAGGVNQAGSSTGGSSPGGSSPGGNTSTTGGSDGSAGNSMQVAGTGGNPAATAGSAGMTHDGEAGSTTSAGGGGSGENPAAAGSSGDASCSCAVPGPRGSSKVPTAAGLLLAAASVLRRRKRGSALGRSS